MFFSDCPCFFYDSDAAHGEPCRSEGNGGCCRRPGCREEKKRPALGAGPYELKCLKKRPQTKPAGDEATRATVEAAKPDPERVIPVGVPLVEMVRGSPVVTVQQGVGSTSSPEPARDRI